MSAAHEVTFTRLLLVGLSKLPGVRVWRQNVGTIAFRRATTGAVRVFRAGPPKGAADISGGVSPHGWRLEVEVKMPGGKRTLEQARWAAFCEQMGFVYALVAYDAATDDGANVARCVAEVTNAIRTRLERP